MGEVYVLSRILLQRKESRGIDLDQVNSCNNITCESEVDQTEHVYIHTCVCISTYFVYLKKIHTQSPMF